jgi:hypothetical protein
VAHPVSDGDDEHSMRMAEDIGRSARVGFKERCYASTRRIQYLVIIAVSTTLFRTADSIATPCIQA